jgi:hypothetical protein
VSASLTGSFPLRRDDQLAVDVVLLASLARICELIFEERAVLVDLAARPTPLRCCFIQVYKPVVALLRAFSLSERVSGVR